MKYMVFLCALLLSGCDDGQIVKTTIGEYGYVKSIDDCDIGKHSKVCRVSTTYKTYRFDLKRFPRNMRVGERLFLQKVYYENKIVTSYCKSNTCSSISVCFSWMPCYE